MMERAAILMMSVLITSAGRAAAVPGLLATADAAAPPLGNLLGPRNAAGCPPGKGTSIILQDGLDPQNLPAARPAAWPECPLDRCTRSHALRRHAGGAIAAAVAHAPIAGVTPEMMVWWFSEGVGGSSVDPRDGRAYSNYLIWHGDDHNAQTTVKPGPSAPGAGGGGAAGSGGTTTGAVWRIDEFFGAAKPGGYVRGDPACALYQSFWTNTTMTVARLDLQGLALAHELPALPGLPGAPPPLRPVALEHTWRASPAGLRLESSLRVGDPALGRGPLAKLVNGAAAKAFGGDDAEGAARAWQRHCAQEMHNLAHFLPRLYAAHVAAKQRQG